jgi:hypothetical protein
MFVITEADADAIRAVFNQERELSAATESRWLVPSGHRQRESAGVRSAHRWVGAAVSPAAPGDAAAPSQEQLARLLNRSHRKEYPAGGAPACHFEHYLA